jgi:hypothetical protein
MKVISLKTQIYLPSISDVVDELYSFPEEMTGVTPIYLALGRRGLKLEYHYIITN